MSVESIAMNREFPGSRPLTRIRTVAANRTLGAILVDAGRLSIDNAEQVLRVQKENDLLFGEAAVGLGLLTNDDIRFALSKQFEYACLPTVDESLSPELVAAYAPFGAMAEKLRALRSQLMLRWLEDRSRPRTLAIVSPERGDGRSFIAANLAIIFSQLGERTLLIDANLRSPRQQNLFRLKGINGLTGLLSGRFTSWGIVRLPSLPGLSILPAGIVPPNPQELLGQPALSVIFESFSRDYDVIIIDTPAAAMFADAQTIAVRAGAALLLARNDQSSLDNVRELATCLKQSGVSLVGAVLNDSQ